jgi:hypothetical protein
LYGVGFIKGRILPGATGEFLDDIASICKDMPVESLRPKYELDYAKNPTASLQARLITYGSEVAIRDYVNKVKKEHRINEEDAYPSTPTHAVKAIREMKFLPLLGELIPVVCDSEFKDAEFSGLYNSLSDALIGFGERDMGATISMVETYRASLGGQDRSERFCNYVVEEIKRNDRRHSDQPLSLQQVIHLIN